MDSGWAMVDLCEPEEPTMKIISLAGRNNERSKTAGIAGRRALNLHPNHRVPAPTPTRRPNTPLARPAVAA